MVVEQGKGDAVTGLVQRFRRGDSAAAGQLMEAMYPELRRLARIKMSAERAGHTWQPTELLNELYFELIKVRLLEPDDSREGGRSDFLNFAAFLMKRLLIRHARPMSHRAVKVKLEEAIDCPETTISGADAVAELDLLMDSLSAIDPKIRTVVELRVFGGLTRAEIAEQMGIGTATVSRYWAFAQQWLKKNLDPLRTG